MKTRKVLVLFSIALNLVLIALLCFSDKKALADIASSKSALKNYEEYYQSLGSYFTKSMYSITGKRISVLYNSDEGVLYLYNENGPILAYGGDSVEIYPPDFKGQFHDRGPNMVYYDRDSNVLSYYDGSYLKIGALGSYPEVILNTEKKTVDAGLLPYLEGDPENKIEKIFKGNKECKFLEPEVPYFACCLIEDRSEENQSSIAEGYVYLPANKPRWNKIKEAGRLDQSLFDYTCNELYRLEIYPDHELRKELGKHLFDMNHDAIKKELQHAIESFDSHSYPSLQ